jgi:predicted nucleotidyltransferase
METMDEIKKIDIEIYEFIVYFKDLLLENNKSIIGIYLFGSLAYGGFDKGRSDIDIVVITKTLIEGSDLNIIKNIHKKMENINKKWSERFEASYTPIEMLKEKEPPQTPRPYYGGVFYDDATYGNEWLINNYLLYNHGISIYGPDFKKLLQEPININEIKLACINDFYKEWIPKINEDDWLSNSHYQSYLVLNICRIIYTINKLEVANKQKSCNWIKNNYSEWKGLIEEAEKWNYGMVMDRKNSVKDFILFAEKVIENSK